MKVGIDLSNNIRLGTSGGLALLLKGLLEALFAACPKDRFLVFCTRFNSQLIGCWPPMAQRIVLPVQSYYKDLDTIASHHEIDVLFRGYPFSDHLRFPMSRQIVLIPDIQQETFPEFFTPAQLQERRAAFDVALAHAGAIATISKFSSEALRAYPGRRCEDIFLVKPALADNAVDTRCHRIFPVEAGLIPSEPFLFYPANLWPHKNHKRVFQAFGLYLRGPTPRLSLVLTGDPSGWHALRSECRLLPVQHLGFVSGGLLRLLYRKARALAFFSLYEGFGMPLLEAFGSGTPVMCSNTTSLPEVGGDAVLMCDPTDIEAMAAAMERVAVEDGLRAELASKGFERLKHFTWQKSCEAFAHACHRVIERAS